MDLCVRKSPQLDCLSRGTHPGHFFHFSALGILSSNAILVSDIRRWSVRDTVQNLTIWIGFLIRLRSCTTTGSTSRLWRSTQPFFMSIRVLSVLPKWISKLSKQSCTNIGCSHPSSPRTNDFRRTMVQSGPSRRTFSAPSTGHKS